MTLWPCTLSLNLESPCHVCLSQSISRTTNIALNPVSVLLSVRVATTTKKSSILRVPPFSCKFQANYSYFHPLPKTPALWSPRKRPKTNKQKSLNFFSKAHKLPAKILATYFALRTDFPHHDYVQNRFFSRARTVDSSTSKKKKNNNNQKPMKIIEFFKSLYPKNTKKHETFLLATIFSFFTKSSTFDFAIRSRGFIERLAMEKWYPVMTIIMWRNRRSRGLVEEKKQITSVDRTTLCKV